jgi:hypothetical protein
LHKDFLQKHPAIAPPSAKLWLFEKIFNREFNIEFGYPHSDICSTCETLNIELVHLKNQTPVDDAQVSNKLKERPIWQMQAIFIPQ